MAVEINPTKFDHDEVSDKEISPPSNELSIEEEDDDSSLDLNTISFTPVNFSTSSRRIIDLYRSWKEDNDLDPRPSFQRGYVWDKNRATKLIESILLHVPLPLIYTAEEENGMEVVIDGQQRLTTCFSFIDGYFPLSNSEIEKRKKGEAIKQKPFKLGKMKILSDLKNKSYKDLEKGLQAEFNRFQLQIIKISKDSHQDVKFEIFERLNTGSVSLSDQEIRNCIYRGAFNDLLAELAAYPQFRQCLSLSGEAARMQDVELVLRFCAFNELTHLNFNGKMRAFLNVFMRDRRNISKEQQEKYRNAFYRASDITFSVFGDLAFRRFSDGSESNKNGRWEKAVNKAVFDVIMFWFSRYDKRQIIESKDAIREKFIELCIDDRDFIDAITLGTADPQRVRTRFERWGNALNSIVSHPTRERRLFSLSEKTEIFSRNSTCGLCGQRIEHLDDCEVDHKVPFELGGVTTIDNAQITHRFCNRSKGKSLTS